MKTSAVKKMFPKRGTKVTVDDFYQYAVDEFEQGYFKFISIWKKVPCLPENNDSVNSISPDGYIVTVYSYSSQQVEKLLLCSYNAVPYANNYHVRRSLAASNRVDYAFNDDLEDFASWFSVTTKKQDPYFQHKYLK